MGFGGYNPAQYAQMKSQAVQGVTSGVQQGLGQIAQGVEGAVKEQKKKRSELTEALEARNVLTRLMRTAETVDPEVSRGVRGMGFRSVNDVVPPPPKKGVSLNSYLKKVNDGIDSLASALALNPNVTEKMLDDAMKLPGWSKSARDMLGVAKVAAKEERGRQKEASKEQQQQALGQASRDVAGGLGPASPVLDPTTGEQAFTEQTGGPPPATQEQALGKFAEFQRAGQAPEASAKDVLAQPSIAQLPKQREIDVQKRFEERQQLAEDKMDAQIEQWKAGVSRTRNEKMRKGQEGNLKWAISHLQAIQKEKKTLERDLAKSEGKASDPTNMADYSGSITTLTQQIKDLDKEIEAYSTVAGTVSSPEGAALNQKQMEGMLQQILGVSTGQQPAPALGGGAPAPAAAPNPNNLRQKYNY